MPTDLLERYPYHLVQLRFVLASDSFDNTSEDIYRFI